MTLILFETTTNVLQMCHTSFKFCGTELEICCVFLFFYLLCAVVFRTISKKKKLCLQKRYYNFSSGEVIFIRTRC